MQQKEEDCYQKDDLYLYIGPFGFRGLPLIYLSILDMESEVLLQLEVKECFSLTLFVSCFTFGRYYNNS